MINGMSKMINMRVHSFLCAAKSPEGALISASTRLPLPTRSLLRVASCVACVRRTSLSLRAFEVDGAGRRLRGLVVVSGALGARGRVADEVEEVLAVP